MSLTPKQRREGMLVTVLMKFFRQDSFTWKEFKEAYQNYERHFYNHVRFPFGSIKGDFEKAQDFLLSKGLVEKLADGSWKCLIQ